MSSSNQITAMLMVKVPDKEHWQGMGSKAFSVLPRTGELIEYDIDGTAHVCKVVAVAHPSEPTVNIGDIYAVQLGKTTDVLKQIFDAAELPESSGGFVFGSVKR
ncbi:hypothetical protein [Leptolyngbya sp. AN10]|uniref:hypothetical protein n=1 Tax=Leptolyngbya sp. AN10 TaxID=3423365 RepID=UPI003D31C697